MRKKIKLNIRYPEDMQNYFIGLKNSLDDALMHVQIPIALTHARIEKFIHG